MKMILFYLAMVNSNFHVDLDRKQTLCMAKAVYHEARGEPVMGQAAVAYVINNRVHSNKHPNTACEVVYQPHQFTNIKDVRPVYSSQEWKTAVEIAVYTQIGLIDDQTNGANIYYNPKKASPNWDFSKLELIGNLKNHDFYREN